LSNSATPAESFSHYLETHPEVTQYCVAFSGGMDSHVLLHVAALYIGESDHLSLRAVHVDHGLQADSDQWTAHCESVCAGLGVALVKRRVSVDRGDDGPEAGARLARYGAFADMLHPGEHLLLAQHAEDQAETFLLQALRGSGPDGLASIPRKRNFASGIMARPLLACSQDDLTEYAVNHELQWIEDPSNRDTQYDRNYLRHEILPLLKARWPAASQTLSRAAMRSAAASQVLLTLAQEDLDDVRVRGAAELSVSELRGLPRERAYNALRLWVRQAGRRMPRLQDLAQVLRDLVRAREDSRGIVNVREYEFRRHSDRLYLLPPQIEPEPFLYEWSAPYHDAHIPEVDVVLSREACEKQGIMLPPGGGFTVRNRQPGDLIKLGQPAYHKAVNKLLQEAAVPPWKRDSIPLLYVDGKLVAVWNIAVSVDFRTPTSSAATPA